LKEETSSNIMANLEQQIQKKKMEQCEFSKRNRSRFTVMLVGKSASPAFYIIWNHELTQ
jgi:hypothetical protein